MDEYQWSFPGGLPTPSSRIILAGMSFHVLSLRRRFAPSSFTQLARRNILSTHVSLTPLVRAQFPLFPDGDNPCLLFLYLVARFYRFHGHNVFSHDDAFLSFLPPPSLYPFLSKRWVPQRVSSMDNLETFS